ncbi:hypothetical protein C8J56DRAFT_945498 [Mycena floridula]|nr:hypothetical protein C8J56DRAFT_945498 [Mycena floridula]
MIPQKMFAFFAVAAIASTIAGANPVPTRLETRSLDLSTTYTDFKPIFAGLLAANRVHERRQVDVPVPVGYDFVFGPLDDANNAPGFMGFVFIDTYDTIACANICNNADPDTNGGACKAFNIWQGAINGTPAAQVTCALYFLPIDASTATNPGDTENDLTVTLSRGYVRQDLLPDGGFEGFNCTFPTPSGSFSCFTESFGGWLGTSPPEGSLDATIENADSQLFAHIGHSAAQLGSQATDQFPGTLSVVDPLATEPGVDYILEFFIRAEHTPQQGFEDLTPSMNITWNGDVVGTVSGIFVAFTRQALTVTAQGQDTLSLTGGFWPSFIVLDDIVLLRK